MIWACLAIVVIDFCLKNQWEMLNVHWFYDIFIDISMTYMCMPVDDNWRYEALQVSLKSGVFRTFLCGKEKLWLGNIYG